MGPVQEIWLMTQGIIRALGRPDQFCFLTDQLGGLRPLSWLNFLQNGKIPTSQDRYEEPGKKSHTPQTRCRSTHENSRGHCRDVFNL